MNLKEIIVFSSAENLANYAASLLKMKIDETPDGSYFSVALSGGSTPKRIFNAIASLEKGTTNWAKIRFFWGDERCVVPDNDESNFKMTRLNLFDKLNIPAENIFRIHGESVPESEAVRYGNVIAENVPFVKGLPCFDMVLLGLGEDGHTASIFPGSNALFHSTHLCKAVAHPLTGQQRITLTGSVINHAKNVVFIVTGTAKAAIVARILQEGEKTGLPASLVSPSDGNLTWLLDAGAAALLNENSTQKIDYK